MPSDPDPRATLEFAVRIAEIGGRARLLLPDHTAGEWCTIEEAIASRQSFMVRPRDDLLVLDGDERDSLDRLLRLAEKFQRAGFSPVVTASGDAGHGHLIVVVRDAGRLTKFRQAGRGEGFDVRGGSRMLRPPGAPHHLPGMPPSRVIYPPNELDALSSLERPWERFGLLSRRMSAVLRYGDIEGRYRKSDGSYPDRSRVVQAIATGAHNKGWTADALMHVFMDTYNVGGEKVREIAGSRGEAAARKYVEGALKKAAALPPPNEGASAIRQSLGATRRAALISPFTGRGGPTEFAVLLVHIGVAEKAGRLHYDLNVRDVALRAGVSRSAASVAHMRLVDTGWLLVLRRGGQERSTLWQLLGPPPSWTVDLPSPSWTVDLYGGVREVEDCPGWGMNPNQAVWSEIGVGKVGFLVWTRLAQSPTTLATLCLNLDRGPRVVTKHLKALREHGLASCDPSGSWIRGRVSPEVASARLLRVHPHLQKDLGSREETYRAERSNFAGRRRVPPRLPTRPDSSS